MADLSATATIKLDFPFDADGQAFTELTMRRPKMKDNHAIQKMKGSDFERGVSMLARLCDVAPEVIHELDELDANKLQEQLNSFRGDSGSDA